MTSPVRTTPRPIVIRGAAVNNLKAIDLDLPARKLIVICGVSGSGKSSLAFDVLYAEGQRRYIESLPNSVRPFLPRLDRPTAERIDGVRPAIAVSQNHLSVAAKTSVAGATDVLDELRLAMARLGRPFCCGREVRAFSPQTAAVELRRLPGGARFVVAFEPPGARVSGSAKPDATKREPGEGEAWSQKRLGEWKQEGFARAIVPASETSDGIAGFSVASLESLGKDEGASGVLAYAIVVDRLSAGPTNEARVVDALETAYANGDGRALVFVETAAASEAGLNGEETRLDGAAFLRVRFGRTLECPSCGLIIPAAEPRLFNPTHPLGACPVCEGQGEVLDYDFDKIVPDPSVTLREGAIAPWNGTPYEGDQHALLKAAGKLGVPLETPFSAFTAEQREALWRGSERDGFVGLGGFFAALETQKHKVNVRTFLARFRSPRSCPACGGLRLRPEALAYRLGGKNVAELESLRVSDAAAFLSGLELELHERPIAKTIFDQTLARLAYLDEVGLGYLELHRPVETLSSGEARRVALTRALGSNLVDAMYILDEPSVGLHPRERESLVTAVKRLAARGNSVLVVEHNAAFLHAADQIVEIGPGAGDEGGKVVFQGTFEALKTAANSLTADFLTGRRGASSLPARRRVDKGRLVLRGARGRCLQGFDAIFPCGALCVVAGPSGSGKST
ncbi:MAG TPA: excinuclease ABC subunit A, partial [Pirellulales bacterium]